MKIVLNEVQRAALSYYFDPDNDEGDPLPLDEPIQFKKIFGQLYMNGAYLHGDGEWATFPDPVCKGTSRDNPDHQWENIVTCDRCGLQR